MLNESFRVLQKIAKRHNKDYLQADPFPHIVFDNFFDNEFLSNVAENFPDLAKVTSRKYENEAEIKLASKRGDGQHPENIKQLLRYLNSHMFIDFLQELTGIKEPLIQSPFSRRRLTRNKKGWPAQSSCRFLQTS